MRIQLMSAAAAGYIGFAKHKWAALEELRKSSGVVSLQKYIDTGEVRIFLRCGVDPLIRLEGDPKEHALWLLPSSDSATGDATLASAPKTTWRKGRMKDPVAGVLDWKGAYEEDTEGNKVWTDSLSWNGPPCRYAPGRFDTVLYRNGQEYDTAPFVVYGAGMVNGSPVVACREGYASETQNFGVKLYRKVGGEWECFFTFTPPDNSFNTTGKTIYNQEWEDRASSYHPVRFPWLFSGDGMQAVTLWPLFREDYEWSYYTRPLELTIAIDEQGEWSATTRWLDVVSGAVVDGTASPVVLLRSGSETETLTVNDDDALYDYDEDYGRDRTLTTSSSLTSSYEYPRLADFVDTELVVLCETYTATSSGSSHQGWEYTHDGDHVDLDTESFCYSSSGTSASTTTLSLIQGDATTVLHSHNDSSTKSRSSSSDRESDDDWWMGLDERIDYRPQNSVMSEDEIYTDCEIVHADVRHGLLVLRSVRYHTTLVGSGAYWSDGRWRCSFTTNLGDNLEQYLFVGRDWTDSEQKTQTWNSSGDGYCGGVFSVQLPANGAGYSNSTSYEDTDYAGNSGQYGSWAELWGALLFDDVFALNGSVRIYSLGDETRAYSRYQPINLTDVVELPAGDNQMYRPIGVAGYMPRNKI